MTADPVMTDLLATLERYAEQGRFYNLDALCGSSPEASSPKQLWEDLHSGLWERDPSLIDRVIEAGSRARQDMNDVIAQSFRAWWTLYYRSWQHGLFGADPQSWSVQLGTALETLE